jgi:hypothetical protein
MTFTVIRDTREKIGWWDFKFIADCDQISKAVKTGDYTLVGYEDQLAVERKRTVLEIARNLGHKYQQFKAELIRMQDFKYRYIICEFSLIHLLDYPANCGLKQSARAQIKKDGRALLKQIQTIETKYNVPFIFCNDKTHAMQTALEIFNNVIHSN